MIEGDWHNGALTNGQMMIIQKGFSTYTGEFENWRFHGTGKFHDSRFGECLDQEGIFEKVSLFCSDVSVLTADLT